MLGKFLGAGNSRPARPVIEQQSGFTVESRDESTGRVFDDGRPFPPQDVDQKARILSRPQPQYTEEARAEGVEGTVVLRAVFSADGRVTDVRVLSGLPDGLTESAVEAARQIKFTPALKDGRAVPQYIQIEYNFFLF